MRVSLSRAAALLRTGEPVAFPTETVYGLGASVHQPLAVRRIFALKGRPADHPLIVHFADAAQLARWVEVSDAARVLAGALWPGPLTLILPRKPVVPDVVTGGLDTVGVRIPSHPLARQLLTLTGPLAAPSANRFGRISPTTAAHVAEELGESVAILDGGPCAVGVESTIVDLTGPPALLRPGGVPRAAIEALIGPLGASATRAPGTLPSHYAPHTALLLSRDPDADAARLRASGQSVAVLRAGPSGEHAQRLYAELRRLDQEGVGVLIAELSGEDGLGDAINARLRRAAARG